MSSLAYDGRDIIGIFPRTTACRVTKLNGNFMFRRRMGLSEMFIISLNQ
jgi:hypothetical protein